MPWGNRSLLFRFKITPDSDNRNTHFFNHAKSIWVNYRWSRTRKLVDNGNDIMRFYFLNAIDECLVWSFTCVVIKLIEMKASNLS